MGYQEDLDDLDAAIAADNRDGVQRAVKRLLVRHPIRFAKTMYAELIQIVSTEGGVDRLRAELIRLREKRNER